MKKDALIDKITAVVQPIADELNYELYYVEYLKENGEYYLRIYIDKPDGISLIDCETLSRRVSSVLDIEDPIQDSYCLEVSSPGLNRGLYKDEHYLRFVGSEVFIKFTGSLDGIKEIKGILKAVEEEVIIVQGEVELIIPKEKIKSANLNEEV
ncbi:ribosome maturation factor RimP [Clostridium vincentii]|uniref:Ribosome maturation factor RimP n=1 Tax=Clostridium vincentii TaxID=52704 RepID=A0A2T0BFI5_9CLOT|nr:ribosome maturation factor RimP [Clostridium vincentii]PRR82587.1 Ribosome maturation factor RimP [Clostridium vincentii]